MRAAFVNSELNRKDVGLKEARIHRLVMLSAVAPPAEFPLQLGDRGLPLVVDDVENAHHPDPPDKDVAHEPPDIAVGERPQGRRSKALVDVLDVGPVGHIVSPGARQYGFGAYVGTRDDVSNFEPCGGLEE